jgi:hypothetical protein
MAKALTLRDMAKNFQRQADTANALAKAQDKAAKQLPRTQTSIPELTAALSADDQAIRYEFMAESFQAQADEYTRLANDAGEAP